jgi:hypothetical protein
VSKRNDVNHARAGFIFIQTGEFVIVEFRRTILRVVRISFLNKKINPTLARFTSFLLQTVYALRTWRGFNVRLFFFHFILYISILSYLLF